LYKNKKKEDDEVTPRFCRFFRLGVFMVIRQQSPIHQKAELQAEVWQNDSELCWYSRAAHQISTRSTSSTGENL
jgi:hypothetical protein